MKRNITLLILWFFILWSINLQTFALTVNQKSTLSKQTEKAFMWFEKNISNLTTQKQIEKLDTLSFKIGLVLQKKLSEKISFVLNHLKNIVDTKSNSLKWNSQPITQNQNNPSTKITVTEDLFNKLMKGKDDIEKDLSDKVWRSEVKMEDFGRLISEKIHQLYLSNWVKEENIFYFENLIWFYKDNERTNSNWKNLSWNEKISFLENTYNNQSWNIANEQEEWRKGQADLYFKKTGKDWYALTSEQQQKFFHDNQTIDPSYYENFTYLTPEDKQKYLSEIKSKVNKYIEINSSNEFNENGVNKVLTMNYNSYDYTIDTLLQMYLHWKITNINNTTALIKKWDTYFLHPMSDYKVKISISIDELKKKVSKYSDKVSHLNGFNNNISFFSEKKVFFIEENGVKKFIIFPQGFTQYDGLDTLDGISSAMLFSYSNNTYFAKEYKIVDIPNFSTFKVLDRPDTTQYYVETFIPFDVSVLNNNTLGNVTGFYTSIDGLFEVVKNNNFSQYTLYKDNSRLFLWKGNIKSLNEWYVSTTIKKLKEKMKYFEWNRVVWCEIITVQNQTLSSPVNLYLDHVSNEDEVVLIPDWVSFNNNAIIKDMQTGAYSLTLKWYTIK